MENNCKTLLTNFLEKQPAQLDSSRVAAQHLNIFKDLREQLAYLVEKFGDELVVQIDESFWGEKETPLSVLTKLSGVAFKLIPLERKLQGIESGPIFSGDEELEEGDINLIKKYIEKISN